MEITEIITYKYNGKIYTSLKEVKAAVENKIGAIIDESDVTLTPKQKLNLLAAIVKNKKELSQILDVTFTIEGESFGRDIVKNILDL